MRSADAIRTRCKMLEIVRPFMQKHRFRVFHRLNIFLANQIHACSKAAMTDISRSPTHLALCVTDLSIFLTVCNSVLWTPVNPEPFITYIGAVFGSAAYSSDTLLRTTKSQRAPSCVSPFNCADTRNVICVIEGTCSV